MSTEPPQELTEAQMRDVQIVASACFALLETPFEVLHARGAVADLGEYHRRFVYAPLVWFLTLSDPALAAFWACVEERHAQRRADAAAALALPS